MSIVVIYHKMISMDGFVDVAFAQRQRLHFIETLALWDGAVQRERVSEAFGVAPTQVTRDFTAYREQCPCNLIYDNQLKVYQPTPAATQTPPLMATSNSPT